MSMNESGIVDDANYHLFAKTLSPLKKDADAPILSRSLRKYGLHAAVPRKAGW
jgi:hypothetical protein